MLRRCSGILAPKRQSATATVSKSLGASVPSSPSPVSSQQPIHRTSLTLASLSELSNKGRTGGTASELIPQYREFLAPPPSTTETPSGDAAAQFSARLTELLRHDTTDTNTTTSSLVDSTESVATQLSHHTIAHDHTLLLVRPTVQANGVTTYSFYDAVQGKVLVSNIALPVADDWELADQLVVGGCLSKALLFLCPTPPTLDKSRADFQVAVKELATVLCAAGLSAFSMDWEEVFGAPSAAMAVDTGAAATSTQCTAPDDEFFLSFWKRYLLRSIATFPRPLATPVETFLHYTVPMSAIRVIHVAAGSNLTVTTLNPSGSFAPTFYRGSLTDVLQSLQTLPSPVIWLPTYRSDRKMLLVLRHALQQAGKRPCIVYPSDIMTGDTKSRLFFGSDLKEYWASFVGTSSKDEAFLQVRKAAGYVSRRLAEDVVDVSPAKIQQLREEASCDVSTASEIQSWVGQLTGSPARRQLEAAFESTHCAKPLYISWVATDHASYGRPANPTDVANYVRALRLSDHSSLEWESPITCIYRGHARLPDLSGYSVLVLHDAKTFLLLMAGDVMLADFLQRGGRVWCVSLAQYMLSAQQQRGDQKLSLPNIAVLNGVCVIAPPHAFPNGCCPAVATHAEMKPHLRFSDDALKTIFGAQVRMAVERCQLVNLGHRMESLLACAEIEHRGLYVDSSVAQELDARHRNEIIEMETALLTYVPRTFPVDMIRHFDWMSLHHLRAYFLGGAIPVGGALHEGGEDKRAAEVVPTPRWMFDYMTFLEHHHLSLSSVSSAVSAFAARQLNVAPTLTLDEKILAVKEWFKKEQQVLQQHAQAQRAAVTSRAGKKPSAGTASKKARGGAKHPESAPAVPTPLESAPVPTTFRLVVYDLESTGLNITTDEILEIGFWDPVENVQLSTIINPQRIIPQETVDIHNITQDMADASPPMSQVAEQLMTFLRLTESTRRPGEVLILLSHNGFSLDEPLLRRTMKVFTQASSATTTSFDDILFCDTVVVMKNIRQSAAAGRINLPQHIRDALTSLKLSSLVEALKLPSAGALHRAIVDARQLWGVLRALLTVPASASETVAAQAVLQAMKSSIVNMPTKHCFIAPPKPTAVVRLPGKLNSRSKWKPFRRAAQSALTSMASLMPFLKKLDRAGMDEAAFLHRKLHLQASTSSSLLLPAPDGSSHVMAQHPRDGCIHSLVDMTSTATTRTASSFPSSHTFPKSNKSDQRRMLLSRFGAEHGRMIEVDYSQLEIMIMAVLSRDEQMLTNIRTGVDFHILRAAQYSGESYESIAARVASGDTSAKELRQNAKQFTFQRLYGAGSGLIHKTTGLSLSVIKQSIADEHERYPGIKKFNQLVRCVALRPGNPGLPSHFEFELPSGTRVGFAPRDCVHNLPPLKNYPIQAYGADLVQMMLGKWYRHMLGKQNYQQRAFLVNFVHDSIWLDAHIDVADEVTSDAVRVMSSVQESVLEFFGGTVDIPVAFKCTVSSGPSLHHV